jgi:hypothetical protein
MEMWREVLLAIPVLVLAGFIASLLPAICRLGKYYYQTKEKRR